MSSVDPTGSPSLRARAAAALVRLGGRIHRWLFDLATVVDPRLGLPVAGRGGAWAGLAVLLLLVAGIALLSGGAVWAIREALLHREATP